MRKYTAAEGYRVLTPEEHERIGETLDKLEAKSVQDLSDVERENLREDLAE